MPTPATSSSHLWIAQAVFGLAGMTVLASAPVEGRPVLIVSLIGESQGQMLARMGESPRLAGRGPFAGALILASAGPHASFDALGHGAIAIAAPSAMCGKAIAE